MTQEAKKAAVRRAYRTLVQGLGGSVVTGALASAFTDPTTAKVVEAEPDQAQGIDSE